MLTFSSTGFGAPSTKSFASFKPRFVRVRTSLITWIFLSPPSSKMTSNSSCPDAAASAPAPPAAGAAATATGAAAVTPNVSSNCLTKSASSIKVISLKALNKSSFAIFAIFVFLFFF